MTDLSLLFVFILFFLFPSSLFPSFLFLLSSAFLIILLPFFDLFDGKLIVYCLGLGLNVFTRVATEVEVELYLWLSA